MQPNRSLLVACGYPSPFSQTGLDKMDKSAKKNHTYNTLTMRGEGGSDGTVFEAISNFHRCYHDRFILFMHQCTVHRLDKKTLATLFYDLTRDSLANNFVRCLYRFHAQSLYAIRSKVISYITVCNLA